MDLIQIFVLAVVQGLTEFLPISSSAHLILFPHLAGWEDQGLAFDVAVHLGTLSAVVWYFRQELSTMSRDWAASVAQRQTVGDSRLAWAVLLGTIPVGLAGLFLKHSVEHLMRSPIIIAWASIGFGLLLWVADISSRKLASHRSEHQLTWKDVALIGCAQAVALIPGTSRSGITLTAGMLLGLSRSGAARFSFLLSIPVIVLAGGLSVLDLIKLGEPVDWFSMGLGAVLSGLSGYLCIHFFLKLLERMGMLPYVIYRIGLGVVLITLANG